jgi:SAM-dependent methyltransferase
MQRPIQADKDAVRNFWERASCGEELYLTGADPRNYEEQARERYRLEPYIDPFADFENTKGKRVLEIGVGLGADHERFARAGAILSGVDLTERAIFHTRRRFELLGLASDLSVGDAENLHFDDESFDLVYSWGVIHHSPNTAKAVAEIYRVLCLGGRAKIMIYHKWSLVGFMLWIRHALLRLRPWKTLADIFAEHLESPGTKAYSVGAARKLLSEFREVNIRTVLTHGDLLESGAGQRHRGPLLTTARLLWPRALLRRVFAGRGLFMLIIAVK